MLEQVGFILGGIAAGEGSFTTSDLHRPFPDGEPRVRFVFKLEMASRDRAAVVAFRSFLGYGAICEHKPRKEHWEPSTSFTINSITGNLAATVPFAERYLLPSAKRSQFERWRERLVDYERRHPIRWRKGPSECSVEGCTRPVRGRGVCRIHYYRLTGY